jgi:hypothetical protein
MGWRGESSASERQRLGGVDEARGSANREEAGGRGEEESTRAIMSGRKKVRGRL